MAKSDVEVAHAPSPMSAEDVGYWTEERMAAAAPLPLPELEGWPSQLGIAGQYVLEEDEIGEPESEDPMSGDDSDIVESQSEQAVSLAAANYVTTKVKNMDVSPYAYVGKLFMTIGGKDWVGSAWCIYESSIFTAGHCVFDSGDWASNVTFMARYSDGTSIGTWSICNLVFSEWLD